MKRSYLLGMVLGLGVVGWTACERVFEEKGHPLSLRFLSFTDHGCRGPRMETPKAFVYERPCLVGYEISNHTLILRIRHTANCCPGFVPTVGFQAPTVLSISLQDTLQGCRCLCTFENDFSFQYAGNGPLRILFSMEGFPPETGTLDTLVHLP